MIAMQYSFTFPTDYDMEIIQQRIANKGHLTDKFPELAFKAYLYALAEQQSQHENQYAPFYLWHNNEGVNQFLSSAGFKGLVDSFGWPSVKIWSVLYSQLSPQLHQAVYATEEIAVISPYTNLDTLAKNETELAQRIMTESGASGCVIAFEPTTWTLVKFYLWGAKNNSVANKDVRKFNIGHISIPQ